MPQIFSSRSAAGTLPKALRKGIIPIAVEVAPGQPGVVSFSNGSRSFSSCLRCVPAPCMSYAESEVVSNSLPAFPADRNPGVCPANAISRINGAAPVVSSDACIFCGVCASRCPVGAISMRPHAVVDDSSVEPLLETEDVSEALATLTAFETIQKKGELLTESEALVDEMRAQLVAAWARIGDRFPDHLARNLLIASGAGAAMRRKGDNAARMDIVLGPPWPNYGCAEAEFGDIAILDAPRDLMDDIAVSVGRLRIAKQSIVAFVVTDVLPNRRSEYWRIVHDVSEVLGVKIGTVTVLALCMLIWRGKRLSDLPRNLFHVHVNTESYRTAVLEPLLGRKLRIGLAPRPYVDVAK